MSVLNPFSYFGVGYIGSVNLVLWSHIISNNSEKNFFFENVYSADWLNVTNDQPHCLKLVYLINKLVGKKPDLAYHWYSTHLKTFQMFCIIVHLLDRHPMAVSWFHPGHLFTFCEAISHLFFYFFFCQENFMKNLLGKFHAKFISDFFMQSLANKG